MTQHTPSEMTFVVDTRFKCSPEASRAAHAVQRLGTWPATSSLERVIDEALLTARAADAKRIEELLNACKATLAALEKCDLNGSVLWVEPPYQFYGVHETVQERLAVVIEEAESGVEVSVCNRFQQLAREAVEEWDGQSNCDLLNALAEKFGISFVELTKVKI